MSFFPPEPKRSWYVQMKVIKRVAWSHKFTCVGCKSELEAFSEDVRCGEFGGSYCENGDTGWYVSCVVCLTNLVLDGYGEAKPKTVVFIPTNIKDEARSRR